GTPPSAASGSLTRRVHSTTESGRGSPEATPRANSSLGRLGGTGGRLAAVSGGTPLGPPVGVAASPSPPPPPPPHPAAMAVATTPVTKARRPMSGGPGRDGSLVGTRRTSPVTARSTRPATLTA